MLRVLIILFLIDIVTASTTPQCDMGTFVDEMLVSGPGCRPGGYTCDLNGDHCVDLADFRVLQNEWVMP